MSKKQVFLDIKGLIDIHSKYIKTVEMWNNQVNIESAEKRELPFTMPAVFVSFEELEWQPGNNDKSQRTQNFVIGIRVVIEDYLWNTAEYFDIVSAVNYSLHGRDTTHTTQLQRIAEIQDVDHDNLVIWQINYKCDYIETISAPAGTSDGSSQITLDIDDIELNKVLDIDDTVIRTGDGTF